MLRDLTRRNHRGAPLALLFTDARGRIVFVDNNFLQMLGYPGATSLVGSPLNKAVGIEAESVTTLMQDVARTGYVHERPLTLTGPDGITSVRVLVSSVATYNAQGEFIGADMTFHDAAEATPEEEIAGVPVHGDILQSRIAQIHAEAEAKAQQHEQADKRAQVEAMTRMAEEDRERRAAERAAEKAQMEARVLPQLYFTAQVNALQVLLARMGGPRIHATLEANLNKTATKNDWPIRILGGQITVSEEGAPSEAYQALLHGVVDFGANIIGRAAVLEEMRAVDAQMGKQTCEVADRAGLRKFFA